MKLSYLFSFREGSIFGLPFFFFLGLNSTPLFAANELSIYATLDPYYNLVGSNGGGVVYDVGVEVMATDSFGFTISSSEQSVVGVLLDEEVSAQKYEYATWNLGIVKRIRSFTGSSIASEITYGTLIESNTYHDSSLDSVSRTKNVLGARMRIDYSFLSRLISPKFSAGVFWSSGKKWKELNRFNGFVFLQIGGKLTIR